MTTNNDFLVEAYMQDLQENDPLQQAAGIALGSTIISIFLKLFMILSTASSMYHSSLENKVLTNRVQSLLGKRKWKVRVVGSEDGEKVYNAFSIGGSNVYITKPLYDALTERQRVAILLHEISHSRTHDLITINTVDTLGVFGSVLATIFETLTVPELEDFPPILLFLLHYFFTMFGTRYISRKFEYKSDEYAVRFGYGDDMIEAFNKIRVLAKLPPDCTSTFCKAGRALTGLLSTHPELGKRVERILHKKEIYNVLPQGKNNFMKLAFKLAEVSA